MIPGREAPDEALSRAEAVCQTLDDGDDGVRREVLAHAGSRWSWGVLHALGVYGPMRHAELKRQMAGVTPRMLTRTLRSLERDGLLIRKDFDEVPPRVEYHLTDLGMGLLVRLSPVWTWVVDHADEVRQARRVFDDQSGSTPPWQVPTPMPARPDVPR